MSTRTALDPLFTATTAPRFTERHLSGLASRTLAAAAVPRFLDPDQCTAVLAALDGLPAAVYAPNRVPTPIVRFGPALNDHRGAAGTLDDRYWAAADTARAAWHRAGLRPDPIAHALGKLGSAWGQAVTPATIGGRPVFGGTVREINNGALIHYDEVVREFPLGLFDQRIIAQLAFNVWVAAPESGGATRIWRHTWQPSDERHRDAYGYTAHTVRDAQLVELLPQAGDALLFNPAHYHAVDQTTGRRVACAFFLGLTTTGALVAWS